MELRQKDLATEIANKCKFFKGPVNQMLKALDEVIVETLSKATFEEDVEIHLAKGLIIGSKRKPECQGKDPRNQNDIIVPEKSIPYAKFTYTFKQKINEGVEP